jgi:ubiquinone/menaquinone biosynthesis C-methylase UbiE
MSQSHSHDHRIQDQFTRQAEIFAGLEELHGETALDLLVESASPNPGDRSLDVACGPGTVAAAFAPRVAEAWGLDATDAMIGQARALAAKEASENLHFARGDAYALPFPDGFFQIATCRFALHHFQEPLKALVEMARVTSPGARIVVCDAMASDDAEKAKAFNEMERLRDPSTARFLTLAELSGLFVAADLPVPSQRFYAVRAEREALIGASFPDEPDGRERLRLLIDAAVDGDKLGMNARRRRDTVLLSYPSVILAAVKP